MFYLLINQKDRLKFKHKHLKNYEMMKYKLCLQKDNHLNHLLLKENLDFQKELCIQYNNRRVIVFLNFLNIKKGRHLFI